MNPLLTIMKKILADSYSVYLKTQNYHWNVVSKHAFYGLHKLFEEQYQELAVGIDDLAEQIRQMGSLAPASFSEYQVLTDIKEGDASLDASGMIKDLAKDQHKLMNELEDGIKIAEECGDPAAVDLLSERLRVHSKNKWMLESS